MKNGSVSVYNEGVTWLVGLSAAAVGGAFLHYDALAGEPWYARLLFLVAVLSFLAAVGLGVHYAFWLYYIFNQQERQQKLEEELRSQLPDDLRSEILRQLEAIKGKIANARTELGQFHRYLLRSFSLGLCGAALILALAVFSVNKHPASDNRATNAPVSVEGTLRLGPLLEQALIERLRARDGKGDPATLDPKLEAALWQHLAQKSDTGTGTSPWVVVVLVLLTIGLIAIVWWSLADKPEATPLTLAIATLTAVSAAVERLAPKGGIPQTSEIPGLVETLMALFALVGLALLVRGLRLFFSITVLDDSDSAKSKSLIGASLLVFGFSAALAALIPAILFHREVVATKSLPCPKCPDLGVIGAPNVAVLPLTAVDGLGDGRGKEGKAVDPSKILQVTQDLKNDKAKAGDILLLLGSADCIPTKPKEMGGLWKDNAELADARANWVNLGLDGQAAVNSVKIKTLPLPQHARCGLARNLRAVYPFLIHAE